jgi:hypothetical protein
MKIGQLGQLMILGIVLFISCSKQDESTKLESRDGIWQVKNISGGFAGIDDEYETGVITWTFNNQILTVENNENQGHIFSGFESGTYNYTVSEIDGINYIIINNAEFGSYTLSRNELIIDQNIKKSGTGADRFILQFNR